MQMINELRLQIQDMENEEYKLDIIKHDLGMNSCEFVVWLYVEVD